MNRLSHPGPPLSLEIQYRPRTLPRGAVSRWSCTRMGALSRTTPPQQAPARRHARQMLVGRGAEAGRSSAPYRRSRSWSPTRRILPCEVRVALSPLEMEA